MQHDKISLVFKELVDSSIKICICMVTNIYNDSSQELS